MRTDTEKEAGSFMLKCYGEFFKKQHQDFILSTKNDICEDNKTFLPIQIRMGSSENVPMTKLVASDNTLMSKVLGVLSSLCVEVIELKKEAVER
jgi:hypothetical protein